ncbi:MAG: ABC transporter ATP-binding protein [Acidaminobacteraceae bacterium]
MEILNINNVTKRFKELKAVDGLNLSVEAGEIIGLLGPNGAGKSTLISMIATLLTLSEGEILYKGKSIKDKKCNIKKELGLVPQEIALYTELSGYENLVFWGNVYGLRGKELKIRIDEVSKIIGIESRLKDKVKDYSGGMKRRINIGAALLHSPSLLIMDEPTVGIDPQSRKHILDTVKKLSEEGMTIIYTSHYMEEVEYLCKSIHIMDEGRIIASGTKDELIGLLKGENKVNASFTIVNDSLIKIIKQIKGVNSVFRSENSLEILTLETKDAVKDIIEVSNANGSEITGIEILKPNLEAVFLQLTGKELRD